MTKYRFFALSFVLALSAALFQTEFGCSTSTTNQGVMTGNPTPTPTPPATVQPALFIPQDSKEVYNANFVDALTVSVEQRQASDKTTVIETKSVSYTQDNTTNQVNLSASFANGQSVTVTARFDPTAGGAITAAFLQLNGTGTPTCIVPAGSSTNVCQALIVQTVFQAKDASIDFLTATFLDAATVSIAYSDLTPPGPGGSETKVIPYTLAGSTLSFGTTFASSGRTMMVTATADATGHLTATQITQNAVNLTNCAPLGIDGWNCSL